MGSERLTMPNVTVQADQKPDEGDITWMESPVVADNPRPSFICVCRFLTSRQTSGS